jgi:hypothetical protein
VERVTGIEPAWPAWKAGNLAGSLHGPNLSYVNGVPRGRAIDFVGARTAPEGPTGEEREELGRPLVKGVAGTGTRPRGSVAGRGPQGRVAVHRCKPVPAAELPLVVP